MNDEKLDGKSTIELDFHKDELFDLIDLMMQAHERDITLNQFIENILRDLVDKIKTEDSNENISQ